MKKITKVLSIIMVAIMLIVATSPIVFGLVDPESVTNNKGVGDQYITKIGSNVLSIITTIGIVVSVIVIAGLGIKYITGSAEEKAEYKKSFVPLLVGMVLLLGASSIAKFLISTAGAA